MASDHTPSSTVYLEIVCGTKILVLPNSSGGVLILDQEVLPNSSPRVVGVTEDYQFVRDVSPALGSFLTAEDLDSSSRSAVLGAGVAEQLFGDASPIGERITISLGQRLSVSLEGREGCIVFDGTGPSRPCPHRSPVIVQNGVRS